MMMLTTQLAYNSSVSALTKPQERPNSSPINTASAIGLVETDSYETGEQSMQVVGNPQARSGKFIGMGMLIGAILATAVTAYMSNEGIRKTVGDLFRKLTGGANRNESSHRSSSSRGSEGDEIVPNTSSFKGSRRNRKASATEAPVLEAANA